MDRRQALIYGLTGQKLEFYPAEWSEGAPSGGVTYSVWAGDDGDDDTAEFTGTATSDSISVALTSASGYSQTNRRRVNAPGTTLTVGRPVLIANTGGQRELVTPTKLAAASFDVEQPLAYDYAAADTVVSIRYTATVDPTFIATESKLNDPEVPYRVRWVYTVASIARRAWTQFDVVRQPLKGGLTAADLFELHPGMAHKEWVSTRGQKFAAQIDAARERLDFEYRLHGILSHEVRDSQVDQELWRSCAMMLIAEAGVYPTGRDAEGYILERQKRFNSDFLSAKQMILLDQSKSGAITASPVRQMWFGQR